MSNGCHSCGMPIDDGLYCDYCTDDSGNLQAFDERFERMVQWTKSQSGEISRSEAEAKTLDYMATMPAWRDHPSVVGRG